MPGLLEAAVSTALSAATMAMVAASLAATVRVDAGALALGDELLQRRQLEQLVERASGLAGTGPGLPPPVAGADDENMVFAADLDGSGRVDGSSAETTALEVRRDGSTSRVRVRMGRQAMTVLVLDDTDAAIEASDAWGRAAGAADATMGQLVAAPRDEAAVPRRLPFAVVARMLR